MTQDQWFRVLHIRGEIHGIMKVIREEYPVRQQIGLFPPELVRSLLILVNAIARSEEC